VKVCFAVNDVTLSGGVGVILEHAHHLVEDHGFDVTLALREAGEGSWRYRRLRGLRVTAAHELSEERFDVAVATWWRTAYDLFNLDAHRYAYFVQSLEDRFYEDAVDRVQAAVTHDLPVAFITEARWIAETLGELRPDTCCFYVRNGLAKDVFSPVAEVQPRTQGPLRIMVEGAADVWFKGVREAVEATRAMSRPSVVTLVTPTGKTEGTPAVDRVVGPLTQEEMAALYAETDVVVKLSRVEGMFGPPLEGFHKGATCVVTPVTGHEEYVEHGWNGLVTGWDDVRGTARLLDLLAEDRRLLHFLQSNALKTAEAWPSWRQSSSFMAAALATIRERPVPARDGGSSQLLKDVKAASEMMRNERLMLETVVRVRDSELAKSLKLAKSHEEALSTRAYRSGVFLRERVWKHSAVDALRLPFRAVARVARALRARAGR
jgi:glycosyltransferase involved in cell wall biosynthesis